MKKVALSIVLAVLLFCTSACGLIDLVKPSGTGEEVQNPNFVPPQTDICGTWYGSPEKGGVEYVFNPDGTCVIDGQTFIWTVWSETESEIQVECSNGMWITVANLHTGMPTMFDQDIVLTRIPLLWEFCGIWETDRGKVGYLDEYEVQFFDGGHTDLKVVQEGDTLIFTAIGIDGMEQSVRISYTDGYPVAELTDGNGNVTLYYRPENRPPVNESELAYQDAVEKFNTAVSGGYIRYEEDSNKVTRGCNAYAHVYGLFEELGDYKDSKEYLSKFRVIEDVLIEVSGESVSPGLLYLFGEHDSLGRRLTGKVFAEEQRKFGIHVAGMFYKLTYGDDGRISEILTHDGDENNPVTIGIPAYDEAGNMISVDVRWFHPEDGVLSYTSTFTYDENGSLLTVVIPVKNYVTYFWYHYDENGVLIQITKDRRREGSDKASSRSIYEYIYDENGYLTETRVHENSPGDGIWLWRLSVTKYTYDENGLPLTRIAHYGYVLNIVDENGNSAVFETLGSEVPEEQKMRYYDIMESVFGKDALAEDHNWIIDTTKYEFTLLKDMYTLEPMGEPSVYPYTYTDVYIYCP